MKLLFALCLIAMSVPVAAQTPASVDTAGRTALGVQ